LVATSIKIFLYLSYITLGCQMNCKGVLLNISCVGKCFLIAVLPTEDLNVSTNTVIYYSTSESLMYVGARGGAVD
jgi:hypothetical protein